MLNKIDKEVAQKLVGKRIKNTIQKDEDTIQIEFDDGSKLEIKDRLEHGLDMGLYHSMEVSVDSGGVLFKT
jgi:ribosomal protein S4E